MQSTSLITIGGGTALALPGVQGMRANYNLQRQQAELLIEAGEERCRAMFTQGAITDISTLCKIAESAAQLAPEGSEYYKFCIAAHVEATVRQIERMGQR